MKILQINTFCGSGGSTGRIALDLCKISEKQSYKCVVAYARKAVPAAGIEVIRIGSKVDVYSHALLTRVTDKTGFYSASSTKKFIRKIEEYDPDIIHLHNIHGYYINIETLFKYLSRADKPIVWTLHDCWSFTGHCAYFDYVGCYRWRTGCYKCPQKKEYPKSIMFDNSKWNYQRKKELFTSVKNMTMVTPSMWLAELVKQSFLGKYPIEIIANGIDLDIFKPTESNFREKYNLTNGYVVLGVAGVWDRRKGLNVFVELSGMLGEDFKVVLVGLSKKQARNLPQNILGITRTENVRQLAEIYTAADVFVNPTLEDNFPTVNLEALACGTPVITYRTGGSVESIDETCGKVVNKGDIAALKTAIEETARGSVFDSDNCVNRANLYDKNDRFCEYMKLYGISECTD